MSYEPTTWKDGDLVTSAKLNKMEQGIANGSGGTLVVHLIMSDDGNTATMDKTWQQLYDADFVVALSRYEEGGGLGVNRSLVGVVQYVNSIYTVVMNPDNSSPMIFQAETADSYPVWFNSGSGGDR